jgi:hypothetical protein
VTHIVCTQNQQHGAVIQKLADNDEDLTGAVLLGIPDDFEVFVTTLKNELDIKNFSIRQKLFDAVAAARRGLAGADPADEAAADGDGGEAARGSNARAPLADIDLNVRALVHELIDWH